MIAAVVAQDLMVFSRLEAAVRPSSGASIVRVDDPETAPQDAEVLFVDWSARQAWWADVLRRRRSAGARVVLFGPHTDLEAHASAREEDLGPMVARSRLFTYAAAVLDRHGAAGPRRGRDR